MLCYLPTSLFSYLYPHTITVRPGVCRQVNCVHLDHTSRTGKGEGEGDGKVDGRVLKKRTGEGMQA